MKTSDLQKEVDKKIKQFGFDWSLYVQYIHLVEEVAELGEALTVHTGDRKSGSGESALADHADVKEEVGDILFQLVSISNDLGLNLDEVFQSTMQRYDKKLAKMNHPAASCGYLSP